MYWLEYVVIALQLTTVITKRHIVSSSSGESIENLLYFKDCQHKTKEQPQPQPLMARSPEPIPREPECRFPRMCCALTCESECSSQQPFATRQLKVDNQPIRNSQFNRPQQPQLPVQPQLQKERKKKVKPQSMMQPPIGGRREFGFTKEKIKSLISNDDDIRKILKDLVRVTMQKVDLQNMITAKTNEVNTIKSEISKNSDEDDLE